MLKATQKEPVGSMLWSCLVVMSAVQGFKKKSMTLPPPRRPLRLPRNPLPLPEQGSTC